MDCMIWKHIVLWWVWTVTTVRKERVINRNKDRTTRHEKEHKTQQFINAYKCKKKQKHMQKTAEKAMDTH
jgi:hypothetical protein